ncbi:MAG: hypothetical protein AB7G62_17180 [Magnetospirillum sp.]
MATPVYRHDRNRDEVAKLAGQGIPGYSQQGLTRSDTEFELTVSVAMTQLGRNRYCVALQKAKAEWRLSRIEVDIVTEHPPGSCPYAVVRAHEDQHVAIAQRLFIRHVGSVRARFSEVVRNTRPMIIQGTAGQVTHQLRDRILAGMKSTLAAYDQEVTTANAAIDTPQSYRTETAKCPDWR